MADMLQIHREKNILIISSIAVIAHASDAHVSAYELSSKLTYSNIILIRIECDSSND